MNILERVVISALPVIVRFVLAAPIEEDDERCSRQNQPGDDHGDGAEVEGQDIAEDLAHCRSRIGKGGGDEDRDQDRDSQSGESVPGAVYTSGQQPTGLDDSASAQDPEGSDESDDSEQLHGPEGEDDAEDDENREHYQPQMTLEPGLLIRSDEEEDERLADEDQTGEEIDDPAGIGPRFGEEGEEDRGYRDECGDENRHCQACLPALLSSRGLGIISHRLYQNSRLVQFPSLELSGSLLRGLRSTR